jgi:hypothetical protein
VVIRDEWAIGAWWQNLLWFSAYVLAFGFSVLFVVGLFQYPMQSQGKTEKGIREAD